MIQIGDMVLNLGDPITLALLLGAVLAIAFLLLIYFSLRASVRAA